MRGNGVFGPLALVVPLVVGAAGCEEPPPKKNPFDPPASATREPPPVTEVPKPKGPPDIKISESDAKVGFTTVLVDKPDGRQRLDTELATAKEHIDGKEVTVRIDRKAPLPWVVMMFDALADLGATTILAKTETRKEYSQEMVFTPLAKVSDPPECSLAAMILADRGTAVWKLSGGTALKRTKGFAGPDLSMTGETIENRARGCESDLFFVSAAEGIEWGLAYDLAASTKALDKVKLSRIVLLHETPIAGRKVSLATG